MADLQTAVSVVTPFADPYRGKGAWSIGIYGSGEDITEFKAAPAAGYKHVIVGGRCSFTGAGQLNICSGTNVKSTLQFAARGTGLFPQADDPLELNEAEALQLDKAAAGVTADGWIVGMTISAGSSLL